MKSHKPHIHLTDGQWRCFSFGVFGVRITGRGESPRAAFHDWYFKAYK